MGDTTGRSNAQEIGRVAGAVLLLLVGIAAVLVVVEGGGDDDEQPVAAGSAAAQPSESASEQPSEQPSAEPTADSTTAPQEGRDVLLQVSPQADGVLEVIERVRTGEPIGTLMVAPPPPQDTLRPVVVELSVEVDGESITIPAPEDRKGPWEIQLPQMATEVVLRYVLDGATERSRPALDTRALLVVRPLTAESAEGMAETASTSVIEINGVVVHNLVCSDRPMDDQLCARQEGGRLWRTAAVPSVDSTVVAQVDLPQ